ncbi:MAG TPA: hypothetical protein VG944_06755, partial [Fimbriimonas sp.]|nr:hypothetical protein [Fimbriimonas sp.]
MIEGNPPHALVLFREGCERIESGDVAGAQRLLLEARSLAEGLDRDAFAASLLGEIEARLSSASM